MVLERAVPATMRIIASDLVQLLRLLHTALLLFFLFLLSVLFVSGGDAGMYLCTCVSRPVYSQRHRTTRASTQPVVQGAPA